MVGQWEFQMAYQKVDWKEHHRRKKVTPFPNTYYVHAKKYEKGNEPIRINEVIL